MRDITDIIFDPAPIRWLQQAIGLGHTLPFEILSLIGDTWGILFVIGLALWRYDRQVAFAVATAATVVAPLWLGLSTLFAVSRPSDPGIVVYDELEAGAFPSGHVFHAVAVWGVLAGLTRLPPWLAIVAGAATGLGRVYMGAHYPADVIASLLIGPLFAWGFVAAWKRISWPEWSLPDWVGYGILGLYFAVLVGLFVGPLDPERLRRWELVGIAFAGPLAVALHLGWSRLSAARMSSPVAAGIGLAGLAVLTMVSRTAGFELPWLGAASAGAALLWIFVAVPLIATASHGAGGGHRPFR